MDDLSTHQHGFTCLSLSLSLSLFSFSVKKWKKKTRHDAQDQQDVEQEQDAHVAAKATRDAVFLSHFEVTVLPRAMLAAAVLSLACAAAMSWGVKRST